MESPAEKPQIEIVVAPASATKPRGLRESEGRVIGVGASFASLLQHYVSDTSADLAGRLWIVPDGARLATVNDALVGVGKGWLETGVKTLSQLAESITSSDLQSRRVLPRSESRRRIANVIESLRRAGRLPLLGPVSERGGLVDAVEQTIAAAKSHGVTAETFAKWSDGPRRSQKDYELSAIYTAYQKSLDTGQLADVADRFARATECLQRLPEKRYQLLVVDDFDRLAIDEWQFTSELMRRCERVIVTAVGDGPRDVVREELFADPQRMVAMIRAEFNESHFKLATHQAVASQARLSTHTVGAHAADEPWPLGLDLFADDAPAGPCDVPCVELLKANTPTDEWRQIARQVKQWLLSGACRPDEIVIAAATLPAERDRAASVLGEYGIPASVEPPRSAASCEVVRTLLDLLALHTNDWAYDNLLGLLTNPLLATLNAPADWRSQLGTLRACAEWTVRDLQIVRGRVDWQRELARRTAFFAEDDTLSEQTIEASARAWRALATREGIETLATALDEVPKSASASGWGHALVSLATAVGLDLKSCAPNGWDVVVEALAWAGLSVDGAADFSLYELIEFIGDVATSQPLASTSDRVGRVRVVPLTMAARMNCRRLVLVGMDETAFSARESAARIYSASDWLKIAGFDTAPVPRYAQQMLLFYRLVSLPSEVLLCSYTALDGKAQLVPPSPFLHDLDRAIGGRLTAVLATEPTIAVVRDEAPLCERELRRVAVVDALANKPDRLVSVASLTAGKHTIDALAVVNDRSRGESFGRFEGIATSDEARAVLAKSFGSDCQWSVSQLETYAECPFKFAARYVARCQPLGDLTLATNHARRGQLAHGALWELHRRLRQSGHKTPLTVDFDEYLAMYAEAVEATVPTLATTGVDAPLVRVEAVQVTAWSEKYLEQSKAYHGGHAKQDFDEPPIPEHFEWRFGRPSRASVDEKEDDRSTDEPFLLKIGNETIKFGGRIDRIDVGRVGDTIVFNIVDYKTMANAQFKVDEVASGHKLQLPLYAWAVAELLFAEKAARPLAAGYWELRKRGFHDKTTLAMYRLEAAEVTAVGDWLAQEQAVRARVVDMVTRIRHGEFPMQNDDEHCTSRCEYSQVCRVAQVRALEKTWPPPAAETNNE